MAGFDAGEVGGDIGAPDASILRLVRDAFLETEPLVEEAAFDSVLSPRTLHVSLSDGIGDSNGAKIDVAWYSSGAYSFHYTDSDDVNWRFDRHPNPHSPEKHFHEPPDAETGSTQPSCITVEEPRLVARAVVKLWRKAYETESLTGLNAAHDPP